MLEADSIKKVGSLCNRNPRRQTGLPKAPYKNIETVQLSTALIDAQIWKLLQALKWALPLRKKRLTSKSLIRLRQNNADIRMHHPI